MRDVVVTAQEGTRPLPDAPRVIIAGSRDINGDLAELFVQESMRVTRMMWDWKVGAVLSGKCRGIDTAGEKWAKLNKAEVEEYPADWDLLGDKAGPLRNAEMVQRADALVVIAFRGSKGSADVLRRAKAQGLWIYRVQLDPDGTLQDMLRTYWNLNQRLQGHLL